MGLPHTSLGSLHHSPTQRHGSCLLQWIRTPRHSSGVGEVHTGLQKKYKVILTKWKYCILAESLLLAPHLLDTRYWQAKHKGKDICLKLTGGHCDSIKKIQLALILKTSHRWDWDSKPALGSKAKTHSEQTPAKDSKGN